MIVSAIIPAAGLGLRLKSSVPKPLVKIDTRPILIHTLGPLSKNNFVAQIIIAVDRNEISKFRAVLNKFQTKKRIDLVFGGARRSDSVANCLKNVLNDADLILVQDAVRPFASGELITKLIKKAYKSQAVVCGVPVKATIKRVTARPEGQAYGIGKSQTTSNFVIEETLKRENLWEIQTPQVFRKELLIQAYKKYKDLEATDDASLVERLGVKIQVVLGSYFNIKITTQEDLVFARAILNYQESIKN